MSEVLTDGQRDAAEPYRVCNKCGEEHPIENFPRYRSQPGRRRQCRSCCLTWRRGYVRRMMTDPEKLEARRIDQNQRNRKLRQEIIEAYGGVCECCGETEPLLLNIDHVNNDGSRERMESNMFSQKLWYRLRREGYPRDRYQLLCVSCNMGKAKHGDCPHRLNAPSIVEMARGLLRAA